MRVCAFLYKSGYICINMAYIYESGQLPRPHTQPVPVRIGTERRVCLTEMCGMIYAPVHFFCILTGIFRTPGDLQIFTDWHVTISHWG